MTTTNDEPATHYLTGLLLPPHETDGEASTLMAPRWEQVTCAACLARRHEEATCRTCGDRWMPEDLPDGQCHYCALDEIRRRIERESAKIEP